jgi:hypothetical protein
VQPCIVECDRGRGGDRPDELRIVVERRVVHECPQLAAVALDRERGPAGPGRRQCKRLPGPVDVRVLIRDAIGQHQVRVTERRREARLQPRAAQRAELAEQVRKARAREPRAQQAPEQRRRNREERRVEHRHEQRRRRVRDQRDQVRGVQHSGQAAAEAWQQGTPSWPRRGVPAVCGHGRDGERRGGEDTELDPGERLHDVGVGPHQQQVAFVGQEQHHGELHDEEPEEERLDDRHVDARREPAAGGEAEDQRRVDQDPQLAEKEDERERDRRVDLSHDLGHEDPEARDRQHRADHAVPPPAPGDEPARRERGAGERVDHVVRRHRRLAVEEGRDQRGEARDGDGRPERPPEPRAAHRRREPLQPFDVAMRKRTSDEVARSACQRGQADHPGSHPTLVEPGEPRTVRLTARGDSARGQMDACKPAGRASARA